MQARKCGISESDYFSDYGWYHIDVGTGSDVDQGCYVAHDKIVGDLFDSSNVGQTLSTTIAARAAYGESHSCWIYDEE